MKKRRRKTAKRNRKRRGFFANKYVLVALRGKERGNQVDIGAPRHKQTGKCGFDRNGSHAAGHYVCLCGKGR